MRRRHEEDMREEKRDMASSRISQSTLRVRLSSSKNTTQQGKRNRQSKDKGQR